MPRHTSATSSVNDPGKGESRSTPAYQTGGSLFLPAILIPLTSSGAACPSVVAGARYRGLLRPLSTLVFGGIQRTDGIEAGETHLVAEGSL